MEIFQSLYFSGSFRPHIIIIFIIINIIITFVNISYQRYFMLFYWSPSDSKSSKVSKTYIFILTDIIYAVI